MAGDEIEFLKRELKKKGYPLENYVQSVLASKEWHIQPNAYFLDKDTNKGRELDIKASLEIDTDKFWNHLVTLLIQCKKVTGNAWIFFSSPSPPFRRICKHSLNDFLHFGYYGIFDIKGTYYEKNAVATNYCEIIVDPKKSNKRVDNIWESVITLIKATSEEFDFIKNDTEQYIEEEISVNDFLKKPFELVEIIYPLIVFEGKIYEAKFSNNDISLIPREQIQLYIDYISGKYKGIFCIDIISKERLTKYLDNTLKDLTLFNERKKENSKKYREDMIRALKEHLSKMHTHYVE